MNKELQKSDTGEMPKVGQNEVISGRRIIRSELALQPRDSLRECITEMKRIAEPCDHSVGVCWCGYWRAMERAEHTIDAINDAVKA